MGHALDQMKKNKALGQDKMVIQTIQEAGMEILTKLCDLFSRCLGKGEILS